MLSKLLSPERPGNLPFPASNPHLFLGRLIFPKDPGMIRARKGTAKHAYCFVVNDELLLSTLRAFAPYTRSLHTTINAWYFQTVCSSGTLCLPYQQQFGILRYRQRCSHRTRHSHHSGDHLYIFFFLVYRSKEGLWLCSRAVLQCVHVLWPPKSIYIYIYVLSSTSHLLI